MPFPVPEKAPAATSPRRAERRATLYERPPQPGVNCEFCGRPHDRVWELHVHNQGLPVDAFDALATSLAPGGVIRKLPYGWQLLECPCREQMRDPEPAEAPEAEPEPEPEPDPAAANQS